MANETVQHSFIFEDEGTCKLTWNFSIIEKDGDKIIEDLKIEERERSEGCLGHPQTISILLKGRSINSINIKELEDSYCKKWVSCGQILGKCLEKINKNGQT